MSDDVAAPPDRATSMLCPVCKVNLLLSDRQGIEIDYCPQCRGVWLDRGELDKIIERNMAYSAAPAAPEPPQAAPYPQPGAGYAPVSPWDHHDGRHGGHHGGGHHGGGHHGGYRRGGFLGRLFDH